MLYESEHTRWMRELLADHPEWVEDQACGRAIWWDRPVIPVTSADSTAVSTPSEPHKAYPYDNNFF